MLTTVGRKSGESRSTPFGWFAVPDGTWFIVASAAGARTNPAWYRNLAAHPNDVTIEVGGESIPVTVCELHDSERADARATITAADPQFTKYEQKTDRELSVIELTRTR